jgi:carbonic anhydrase/acetyltransferase-like protein (isoleucine patch superfamily)
MKQTSDFFIKDMIAKSEFLNAVKTLKSRGKSTLFGNKVRPLSAEEIGILKAQGNRAENWETILVGSGFFPAHIWSNTFLGTCVLGFFVEEKIRVDDGVLLPCGIYNSVLSDTEIGNGCLVQNVGLLSRVMVKDKAVVYQTGSVTASGECTFGNGRSMSIGIETGGREVLSYAEITIPMAEAVAKRRKDKSYLQQVEDFVREYVDACTLPFGVVENGAVICFSGGIKNSYIGNSAKIDGAVLVENSTILSSPGEPVKIEHGALVRNSCLQWGCEVTSMAIVDNAVLTEHSRVERHGKVTQSVIGPNTYIGEGEVTASLVGPFVGFHHQALLIAAIWPEGKGNVGYGANVGSNHTSKAPDQEIWCGEGTFFGLGVNIKFPSDFTEAPYSIIATGVDTLPQKVEFPFSLINKPSQSFPGISPAYNEIFPGWLLSDNIYMVKRNENKFEIRNKAKRSRFVFEVFRPEIIDKIVRARDRLRNPAKIQPLYTDKEIRGLGKNVLAESSRLKGIEAYDFYIRYYAQNGLRRRLAELKAAGEKKKTSAIYKKVSADARWEHERNLLVREGLDRMTFKENLEKLLDMQFHIARQVQISKEKDDSRGAAIISDYSDTHPSAEKDAFVSEVREESIRFKAEVESLVQFYEK